MSGISPVKKKTCQISLLLFWTFNSIYVKASNDIFDISFKVSNSWLIAPPTFHKKKKQKRWELLRKAVRRMLVYDIPPGEKVGVVIFDSAAQNTLPLTEVPSALEERQRLATVSLPRTPSQVSERSKCLLCGLEKAIHVSCITFIIIKIWYNFEISLQYEE